jgi:hypothetical protein
VDASGVRHENKNWTQGLPSEGSSDWGRFMVEFRGDIIIDGGNGFRLTHYNFHDSVGSPADLEDMQRRLLAQFDVQEVKDALGEQLATERSLFEQAWDRRDLYSFYGY